MLTSLFTGYFVGLASIYIVKNLKKALKYYLKNKDVFNEQYYISIFFPPRRRELLEKYHVGHKVVESKIIEKNQF